MIFKNLVKRSLIFLLCTGSLSLSYADDSNSKTDVRKGWFFYDDPVKEASEPATIPIKPDPKPQKEQKTELKPNEPKPNKCLRKDTWDVGCGFVDPDGDFDFQAKQRDELMKSMAMAKQDPKAVAEFQRYVQWVSGQAAKIANMWYYNGIANPDLDDNQPVSAMGISLTKDYEKQKDKAVMDDIRQNGSILYFSKSDCAFCHQMADQLKNLERKYKLNVVNIPLDGKCMLKACEPVKDVMGTASLLSVNSVPAIYIYMKPDVMIKVSTSYEDLSTLVSRITSFFMMYRNAMLQGFKADDKNNPNVGLDFSDKDYNLGRKMVMPTENDVKNLIKK